MATSALQARYRSEVGAPVPSLEEFEDGTEPPALQKVGRIDPGKSVKRGDEETGILDQNVPRDVPNPGELRDDHRVERLSLGFGEFSAPPPSTDPVRVQEVSHLPELSGVGADEGYVGHAYQGYSL